MPANRLVECGRKGLGMKLMEDISAGTFVGEYMGEIVTEHEYHLRRLVRRRSLCGCHFATITNPRTCQPLSSITMRSIAT
jgi:hypothetical protein